MKTLSIGVSGINGVDNPGPGIGVARSLRDDPELDVEIIGLAYDATEPGVYMDWVVDRAFSVPYPSAGGKAYLSRLLAIHEAAGLDAIIPNLDSELPLYIKYADELRSRGIRTFLPTMNQFRLRGKDKLAAVAKAVGLRLPRTAVVTSEAMLAEAVERIGLPVMIKGVFCEAYRAATPQEAFGLHRALAAKWGYPIVVQEVIRGDELNVVGLGGGEGDLLGFFSMKKVAVTAQGKVFSGVTIRNPELADAAAEFVRNAAWCGPFELECIARDGDLYLIEINPRFPAWVYFATGVGVNLPAALIRRCLELPAAETWSYPAGKLLVRYTYDFITDLTPFETFVTRGETP